MSSFQALKLNKPLLQALEAIGYLAPTPIQQKAIPLILAGRDVLGIAQTGTGKTAAYLLPLLMQLKYALGTHPRALVLAPSKELVIQIADNLMTLAKYTDLRVACLYGGIGPERQIKLLQQGTDIVVATPGRLLDLYHGEALYLRAIKRLVLDEADRILDMGFWPQIRAILEVIPAKRQNLLFSATMPAKVIKLSEEFLNFPEKAMITPQATPVTTVSQQLYHVPNRATKASLLVHLLADAATFHKVIVFARTRKTAAYIAECLQHKTPGAVGVMHANKGQNTRINTLNAFKEGTLRILVATDVAARGIDVYQVSHVINFEVPLAYEEYVHRIGRTGRAQHTGQAITFANEAEQYHIRKIEKLIRQPIPAVPFPEELTVTPTSFEEQQEIARELDWQRQKEVPGYQGAFHKKKHQPMKSPSKSPRKTKSRVAHD